MSPKPTAERNRDLETAREKNFLEKAIVNINVER